MKKSLRLILIILCLILFSAQLFALEKLTVILDWFPNPNHAPLFAAQQEGFFKAQGLEVEIISPANPSDPPKLAAAGKADIAVSYEKQLAVYQKQGLPLIKAGVLIYPPLSCLAVSQKSRIYSLKDLKHKTIAYSAGDADILTLETMLHSAGLTLKDVTLINVNYNLTQALMSGRADAITGIMRNFESVQMAMAGFPVRMFYPEDYGVKKEAALIFVVNKNNAHQTKIAKFFTALKKGENYLQRYPDKSWILFAKNHPELNNSLNKKVWFNTLPYFKREV